MSTKGAGGGLSRYVLLKGPFFEIVNTEFHLFWGWVIKRSRSPQVFLPRLKEPQAVTSTPLTFEDIIFPYLEDIISYIFEGKTQTVTSTPYTLKCVNIIVEQSTGFVSCILYLYV